MDLYRARDYGVGTLSAVHNTDNSIKKNLVIALSAIVTSCQTYSPIPTMAEDIAPLSSRSRILALCGAKSNNTVTNLQLKNLDITDDNHEIFYLSGWKEVPEGDPELVGMVHGPFYSWLDEDATNLTKDVITSVQYVLDAVSKNGPFDGIYGFSQGALIASLVAGIAQDYFLKEEIQSADKIATRGLNPIGRYSRSSSIPRGLNPFGRYSHGSSPRPSHCHTGGTMARNSHTHDTRESRASDSSSCWSGSQNMKETRTSMFGRFSWPERGSMSTVRGGKIEPPFKFAILACGAGYSRIKDLGITSWGAGIEDDGEGGDTLINVKSLHIMGIEDRHRTDSEGLASLFLNPSVLYQPGGHSIGREIKTHNNIIDKIGKFVRSRGDPVQVPLSNSFIMLNEVSSIAVQPHVQMTMVQLKNHLLPGGEKHRATILDCLGAQDRNKPFLNVARDTNGSNNTTYGELKDFIHGGDGDLRRIGVKVGDVVAYGAPPVNSPQRLFHVLSLVSIFASLTVMHCK